MKASQPTQLNDLTTWRTPDYKSKWHKAIGQLQSHLWNNIINWLCTLTWNVLSLEDYHLFITSPQLLHSLSVMNTEGKEINLPCQISHRSNRAHESTNEWPGVLEIFSRLHLHHKLSNLWRLSGYGGPCCTVRIPVLLQIWFHATYTCIVNTQLTWSTSWQGNYQYQCLESDVKRSCRWYLPCQHNGL